MPTKQDFLDGRCDEQGNPIRKDAKVATPLEQPTAPEEVETVDQGPVGEEAPAEGQELPEAPVDDGETVVDESKKESE